MSKQKQNQNSEQSPAEQKSNLYNSQRQSPEDDPHGQFAQRTAGAGSEYYREQARDGSDQEDT